MSTTVLFVGERLMQNLSLCGETVVILYVILISENISFYFVDVTNEL